MAAPCLRQVWRLVGNKLFFEIRRNNLGTYFGKSSSEASITFKRIRTLYTTTTASSELDEDEIKKKHLCELFASSEVQELLYKMTGFDMEKIFKPVSKPLKKPIYKFMTDDDLKQALEAAEVKAREKLQMPPYIRITEKPPKILSKDPEIQGLISHNLICVDITPGHSRKGRTMVVRQPDGLLREVTNNERICTNQIFYPIIAREICMPTMFQPEHLPGVLAKEEYIFVLDRACIQFEPYDPEYIRVTETTFKHIDKRKKYDVLRSTRHFGPMTFFLVLENNIEDLMVDMIQRLLVDDAVDLVQLHCRVHRPERWAELETMEDKKKILKVFANEDLKVTGELQLTVQSLYEMSEKEQAVN